MINNNNPQINFRSSYLDTLRIILVCLIFLYHTDVYKRGYLAVDSFIVLSGFLSIASIDKHGALKFIIHRFNRIYKPLFAILFLLTIFSYFFWHNYLYDFSRSILQTIFVYFETGYGRLSNQNYFDTTSFFPGIYLWSLSLEIKFYLFLFIVLVLLNLKNNKYILPISLIIAIIASIKNEYGYMNFNFRASEFLLGVISYQYQKFFLMKNGEKLLWLTLCIALAVNIGKYSTTHLIVTILTCVTLMALRDSPNKSSKILATISNDSYHFFLAHGVGIGIGSIALAYFNLNYYYFIGISLIFSLFLAYILKISTEIKLIYLFALFFASLIIFFYLKPTDGIGKYDHVIYGGESYYNSNQSSKNVYAYGDSHAAMLRYGIERYANTRYIVLKSDIELLELKKDTPLIISFRWIGFDKWIKNHNINSESPNSIAKGYATWLKNTLGSRSNVIIIGAYPEITKFLPSPLNVNCSDENLGELIYLNNADYTLIFNAILEDEVHKLGFKFFNPFNALTKSKNNSTNECFFFDNNHLSTLGASIVAKKLVSHINLFQ